VLAQVNPDREAVGAALVAPFPWSLAVLEYFAPVVELAATTFSWPEESVVELGSKSTWATRLWPAKRVAGKELTTVNAELELLTCSTSIGMRLLFVIETVCDVLVPMFTSPKSIAVGLTAISVDVVLVDEKALESDPHPDNPRQRVIEAATIVATAIERRWVLIVLWATLGGSVAMLDAVARNEKIRNLYIGSPAPGAMWCCRQADAESPVNLVAVGIYRPGLTRSRISPAGPLGTGDDSHERGM